MGRFQRELLWLQFLTDLGAHPHQVRACGLHIALAKGELATHLQHRRNRDTPVPGVQPDDVAHRDFITKASGPVHAGIALQVIVGPYQADQRGTHLLQRLLWLVQ